MRNTKTRRPLTLLCALLALWGLAACDDDLDQAMALSGEWKGDFGMYYDYAERGRVYRFEASCTRLTFLPRYDYATSGTGRQMDYYDYGPYSYQYYSFTWRVSDGVVYLYYDYDPQLNAAISDYRMTNDVFSGHIGQGGEPFQLYKTRDYYDWTPYVNYDYRYGPRNDWQRHYPGYLYAPATHSSDSGERRDTAGAGRVLRRGSRLADKAAREARP